MVTCFRLNLRLKIEWFRQHVKYFDVLRRKYNDNSYWRRKDSRRYFRRCSLTSSVSFAAWRHCRSTAVARWRCWWPAVRVRRGTRLRSQRPGLVSYRTGYSASEPWRAVGNTPSSSDGVIINIVSTAEGQRSSSFDHVMCQSMFALSGRCQRSDKETRASTAITDLTKFIYLLRKSYQRR